MKRMPTVIAATLLLASASAPVAAQTTLHVSGGVTWADLVTRHVPPDGVLRIVAGAALSFPVAPRLNLQLGADYSQKGYCELTVTEMEPDDGEYISAHLDYLEASALLDVPLRRGQGRSLHLLLGPTFGLYLSCEFQGETYTQTCENHGPTGPDAGILLGFRTGIGVSDSMDLTLGAFVNFGVLDVFEGGQRGRRIFPPPSGHAERSANGRNRTITAQVGFAYRIG